MHALLNYNSEITGNKRKRNECMNGQSNLKVRKTEESEDQQEDNSLNQDENKDWDEPIDEENDNEIAGSTVDEEISNNWFGRAFGDNKSLSVLCENELCSIYSWFWWIWKKFY